MITHDSVLWAVPKETHTVMWGASIHYEMDYMYSIEISPADNDELFLTVYNKGLRYTIGIVRYGRIFNLYNRLDKFNVFSEGTTLT